MDGRIVSAVRPLLMAFTFALCTVACGGGDEAQPPPVVVTPPPPPPPPPPLPGTLIGASGGTVSGPSGATVVIPAGALASEVRINIEQSAAGSPALPGGFIVAGLMFAFTPHGTTFAVPVTITVPFDAALVPAGRTPVMLKTINAQTEWQEINPVTVNANTISAAVTSFSLAEAVLPPLSDGRPVHEWQAAILRGDALVPDEFPKGIQDEGDVSVFFDYGDILAFPGGISLPTDAFATGDVNAIADGTDWSVATEAPVGVAGNPESGIGSQVEFRQTQSFSKLAENASLSFTVSEALLETIDANARLHRRCPPSHLRGLECDLIAAEIFMQVEAFTVPASLEPFDYFFRVQGDASLIGMAESWASYASTGPFSMTPFWTVEDFDFTFEPRDAEPEAIVTMKLRAPHTFNVDLSKLPVGQAFTLQSFAIVSAYNRGVGGSEFSTGARALLRDPLTSGGITIRHEGLAAVASESVVTPGGTPVTPEPCVPGPGPDPAAGVLQFSAANYAQLESSRTPVITVTRTGGTTGAVTATLATSNGTAVAGEDYDPIDASVFFADGDSTPRTFSVPLLRDDGRFEAGRTVNLRLSQPGGCVAIGTQDTAVVTILDEDPPPPLPSGLDLGFGTEGEATLQGFGGDRSGMALQPDGKIVMVGGTFAAFVMARFNADGTLDTGFGVDGKVTTSLVSNKQQEALAVAVQPDGKIVVVGHTGQVAGGTVSAVVRYNANGTLDTSFGTGGIVIGTVLGRWFDVILQTVGADLKILVVGDLFAAGDFALARYNTNGSIDTSFGVGGVVITDIIAGDVATNAVLDPQGRIVVSGGSSLGLNNSSVARYSANGTLDSTFANGGTLALTGQNLGAGLAVQSDGAIILAGNIETLNPPATLKVFEIMRLTPAGLPDTSFGTSGIVTTQVSTGGDSALSVVVQPDGKIVAAGVSSSQSNSNFAVARYDTHGALDPEIGNGTGMVIVDFFGFTDIAETVALQPDGKIVLGGLARNNVDGYGVARVNP